MKISKRQWKDMIDGWMKMKGYPVMTEEEIYEKEGGSGKGWYLNLDKYPDSNPSIWLKSNQTDLSVYNSPQYIYSLWYGYFMNSRCVYKAIAKLEHSHVVMDVGGVIFSAVDLLDDGVEQVHIYNIYDSPQVDFATAVRNRFGLRVFFTQPKEWHAYIFSEYLEHFKHPLVELEKFIAANDKCVIYDSSSYCTPAYGHFNPVIINDKEFTSGAAATKEIKKHLLDMGYKHEIVHVYNHNFGRYSK
jgi:hypothetical protein